MTWDDRQLAGLLGENPAPDPAFRYDVFVRVAARARRRASLRRAVLYVGGFALLGAAFPIAHAIGFTETELEPALLAAVVLLSAAVAALLATHGPARLLQRSRALLHI